MEFRKQNMPFDSRVGDEMLICTVTLTVSSDGDPGGLALGLRML